MTDSIQIRNFSDILYFSTISHDTFCEYRLPGHGLMWVRSGRMEIESKNDLVACGAGGFIFWQRDCASTMRKLSDGDTPFNSVAISIPGKLLKDYFRTNVTPGKIDRKIRPVGGNALLLPETVEMESLFYSLLPYGNKGVAPSDAALKSMVYQAVDILLETDVRFYPTLFDFYETWKIDLYDYMKAHFTEDMDIRDFAHYSGRSLSTFKRDFAKISDETPQKWIIRERLRLAARLIADGERPTDVCFKVGFRNKAHFFRCFKDQYGLTPASYRHSDPKPTTNFK